MTIAHTHDWSRVNYSPRRSWRLAPYHPEVRNTVVHHWASTNSTTFIALLIQPAYETSELVRDIPHPTELWFGATQESWAPFSIAIVVWVGSHRFRRNPMIEWSRNPIESRRKLSDEIRSVSDNEDSDRIGSESMIGTFDLSRYRNSLPLHVINYYLRVSAHIVYVTNFENEVCLSFSDDHLIRIWKIYFSIQY